MPTFKYKTTINGKVQAGEIEAENEQTVFGVLDKIIETLKQTEEK